MEVDEHAETLQDFGRVLRQIIIDYSEHYTKDIVKKEYYPLEYIRLNFNPDINGYTQPIIGLLPRENTATSIGEIFAIRTVDVPTKVLNEFVKLFKDAQQNKEENLKSPHITYRIEYLIIMMQKLL